MAVFKFQHETTHAQHCRIHTNLVSLLAELFDCKKAMLEAGQPGELPLMKELSSLRRVRSLRDPTMGSKVVGGTSSTRTPRWKSPVAKTRESRNNQIYVSRSRDMKGDQSSRKASLRKGGVSHSVASPFSDPIHMRERESTWDLGMGHEEASVGMQVKRKPGIKAHRVEVFQQHAPTKNLDSDQFLPQQWRDPSWASDIEASHATSYSLQKGKVLSRHDKSGELTARGGMDAYSRNGYEMQTQQIAHDRMHGSKRILDRYQQATFSGSKQHPEVLSPLALNSLDEIHYYGNSFSLEGNCHDRHNQASRGARGGFSSNIIQSPQYPKHKTRKGQREGSKSRWKARDMLASSTSTSQRTISQSSLSGAWEVASNQLEELDLCELPRNGCGIPCYWSKSQRRGKSQLLDIAERSFACGLYSKSPKKTAHSSSKNYNGRSLGEPCAYPGHEPVPPLDLEALPLLSDPSAYSEDVMGTSADDSDKLSSDLNGELGLHGGDASCALSDKLSSNLNGGDASCALSDKLSSNLNGELGLQGGDASHAPSNGPDSGSDGKVLAIYWERPRSLSQKYRPKVFEELVGQNLVAHALSNAVHKRKVAPVYLFQGSRGTGKTSAARIFAAALNCVTLAEQRPCGVCKECLAFANGKSLDIKEVDAASNNAVEKVKALLQTAFSAPSFSQYKVFIIDECHMLTNETWNALLKLLEEPPRNVVFILITTDPDKLPTMAVSRCQRFPFPKIKDAEIVGRLQALAKCEKLFVEPGALELVAARSDGSLRDAEIILDQLSLLGQKITVSTVHELFGSVSDEKLLGLLDFALSSDTVNTVQRARELIDSGVEPLDLMVQLATLITDILAGSNDLISRSKGGLFFSNHALSEEELERLRYALQVLSDAEKQLRASSTDRTTWLTAALLQLGPARPYPVALSTSGTSATASPVVKTSNGNRQVLKIINGKNNHKSAVKGCAEKNSHPLTTMKNKSRPSRSSFEVQVHPEDTSNLSSAACKDFSQAKTGGDSVMSNRKKATLVGPGNLDSIWWNVFERCKSASIRQLLQSHGKLLAVSISADGAIVCLEFDSVDSKSRSDRCKRNIANSFQEVLGLTVDLKITLASNAAIATSIGARVQAIVDQQTADRQGHSGRSSDATLQQQEQKVVEVGSLHYWRSQSRATSPRTLERANSTKSFPAILTISRSNRVADSDHMMRSLNGTPHFGNGVKPSKKAEQLTFQGTRLNSSGNSRARVVLQKSRSRQSTQEIVLENADDDLQAERMFHIAATAKVVPNNGFHYNLEEENLRLESQSKYGGLLCWRNPKVDDEKVSRQHSKRCAILTRLIPCANSQRH